MADDHKIGKPPPTPVVFPKLGKKSGSVKAGDADTKRIDSFVTGSAPKAPDSVHSSLAVGPTELVPLLWKQLPPPNDITFSTLLRELIHRGGIEAIDGISETEIPNSTDAFQLFFEIACATANQADQYTCDLGNSTDMALLIIAWTAAARDQNPQGFEEMLRRETERGTHDSIDAVTQQRIHVYQALAEAIIFNQQLVYDSPLTIKQLHPVVEALHLRAVDMARSLYATHIHGKEARPRSIPESIASDAEAKARAHGVELPRNPYYPDPSDNTPVTADFSRVATETDDSQRQQVHAILDDLLAAEATLVQVNKLRRTYSLNASSFRKSITRGRFFTGFLRILNDTMGHLPYSVLLRNCIDYPYDKVEFSTALTAAYAMEDKFGDPAVSAEQLGEIGAKVIALWLKSSGRGAVSELDLHVDVELSDEMFIYPRFAQQLTENKERLLPLILVGNPEFVGAVDREYDRAIAAIDGRVEGVADKISAAWNSFLDEGHLPSLDELRREVQESPLHALSEALDGRKAALCAQAFPGGIGERIAEQAIIRSDKTFDLLWDAVTDRQRHPNMTRAQRNLIGTRLLSIGIMKR